MSAIVVVTDSSFESDVLKANTPGGVDFWAEWGGPCRNIEPAVEEIAAEVRGRVIIAKLNVDENPAVRSQYAVRSIPTRMLFKEGNIVATKIGADTKSGMSRWIQAKV